MTDVEAMIAMFSSKDIRTRIEILVNHDWENKL